MRHNITPAKLRLMLFAISITMAVLCVLTAYLSQFRDRNTILAIMGLCIVYVLFRAVHGQERRDLIQGYWTWHKTAMAGAEPISGIIRAAAAWMLLDALWISTNLTTCLTLGIPGVFGIVFQGVFLYGFTASRKIRPDLYDTWEKSQAMDMLEAVLYAQACAVMAAIAIFTT